MFESRCAVPIDKRKADPQSVPYMPQLRKAWQVGNNRTSHDALL
jgi:hypothetical protein